MLRCRTFDTFLAFQAGELKFRSSLGFNDANAFQTIMLSPLPICIELGEAARLLGSAADFWIVFSLRMPIWMYQKSLRPQKIWQKLRAIPLNGVSLLHDVAFEELDYGKKLCCLPKFQSRKHCFDKPTTVYRVQKTKQ